MEVRGREGGEGGGVLHSRIHSFVQHNVMMTMPYIHTITIDHALSNNKDYIDD